MMPTPPPSRRPAWFIVLLVVMALPLLVAPSVMKNLPDDRGLLMGFPLYVLLSIYLAYASWGERRYLSWILLGVLSLSYVSLIFFTLTLCASI